MSSPAGAWGSREAMAKIIFTDASRFRLAHSNNAQA